MKPSVGSDAFVILAFAFISLFVLLLLRHFLPLRTTPAYLTVPIYLALTLPISIILLVPIDLASSSKTEDGASTGIWLPDSVLLVAWRLTYWLTFVLTWYARIYHLRENYRYLQKPGLYYRFLGNIRTQDIERRKTDSSTPSDPTEGIS